MLQIEVRMMALLEFLKRNEKAVLLRVKEKSLALAGVRPASEPPQSGLPIFYRQFVHVLEHVSETPAHHTRRRGEDGKGGQ
ncbi:MAG TPA: hypothetical protein VK629_01510 [Steroidobacteraceae bacterium]|nr:hypothetical protein [Steroidobacteraceae bacterium]